MSQNYKTTAKRSQQVFLFGCFLVWFDLVWFDLVWFGLVCFFKSC